MAYDRIKNHRCTECSHNRTIALKEKKCSYRINNTNEKTLCVTDIDGCYVQAGKRCDYLVVDCSAQGAYFVELKGSDFLHAVDQIESTLCELREDLDGFALYARVVLTKVAVPNLQNNPHLVKFRKRLKALGGNLVYATVTYTETV